MLNPALVVLPAFAFATTSLALLPARQLASASCAHFASGVSSAQHFTLAALNQTLPNANATGAPLVLGQAGAVESAEFEVLSTWASYPFNGWPTLSLVDGGLIANMDVPIGNVVTVSRGADNGSQVSFMTTAQDPPAPAPVYCVVASSDPDGPYTGRPSLALNNETDLFSLCLTGNYSTAQNNVVYNATAHNFGAYIFDSCYPVILQVIGLPQ